MATKNTPPKSREVRVNDGAEPLDIGPGLSFPVVGIGASAGGLAAFTELLKALPPKSGMAFVLIQHLEPKHESALTALLSKATRMPVVEVSDGMAVEPNCVYVIPPNKDITIGKRTLRLTPRSDASRPQRPIDDFSIALAEEQGNAAIGVVLSGTGSDGTYGLKAIKAAGGVTFAQDPKTSQWPAMPISAIMAGAVDFVLTPKRIAAELARIGRHPYLVEARAVPEGSELDKVCLLVRASVGVDFRLYKQATVRRRIARRMALRKIASLTKYANILKHSPEEAQALADDIFIHVTSFFRDPESFLALRRQVLAKLGTKRAVGDPIRIWIAGCSTGEEVYSIAMLLLEELGERANRTKIQIFGTDVQERPVQHARAGIYTEAALSGVSAARLKRFFLKTDHGYQIQTFVRDLCVFARHDLAKDPPFSRLDLISCRNVLIYMGSALQKRLLSVFQYALKPGGFLFLGNSESVGNYSSAFIVEDKKHRIFLRKVSVPALNEFPSTMVFEREPPAARAAASAPSSAIDFHREAEGVLLEQYAPPALVVDPDLHIVHFQGDVSPYLAPATGQPSFHLLKLVRPEFVVDLRTAIDKAKKEGIRVRKDNVQFKQDGRSAAVRLEVLPLKKRAGKKPDLLVVFQRIEPALSGEERPKQHPPGKTQTVERELVSTREHLRALIAEHDTAQEEMKAANEEILSSNEELQSTNQELETAKEELQSANEELVTLNDELQHRNDELTVLTHDLSNLLVGVDIAVVVLDANLHVRRFTPVAGALLNLIPGDVGRPFGDIASRLDVADWNKLLSAVTQKGLPIEREVRDHDGHPYSLRIRPYKTSENETNGVIVVLFDTEIVERTVEEARRDRRLAVEAQLRSESILDSLVSHVAVLGPDGTILATNHAWNRFARENEVTDMTSVGPGANYLTVLERAVSGGDTDAPAALNGIRDVLKGARQSLEFEYPCHSTTEQRWFLFNASPLKTREGGAVISHIDITPRKIAEMAVQKSEYTIRALLDSSNQSVIAVNPAGEIMLANGVTKKMFGYTWEELLNQRLEILIPENLRVKHAEHHGNYFAQMQSRPMGIGLNLEARRKDGTVFPVEIGLSAIETATGKLAVAFVSDITQRRQLEHAAQAHTQQINALAARLLTVQEEERRRVSRELHDQICQQLASLAIDIGGLAASPPSLAEAPVKLKALQTRIIKASEEARHIAYELHPSMLDDLGLVASLQALCKEFSEQNPDTALQFTSGAMPATLSREMASCVFRVAQESLQNIAKHAKAKQVSVTLGVTKRALVLKIADDGEGFDLAIVKGRGGLGLIGAEERARLLNGKVSVTAKPGGGTQIALIIPAPR